MRQLVVDLSAEHPGFNTMESVLPTYGTLPSMLQTISTRSCLAPTYATIATYSKK